MRMYVRSIAQCEHPHKLHKTKSSKKEQDDDDDDNEQDRNLNNRLENYTATINVLMASNNHKLI